MKLRDWPRTLLAVAALLVLAGALAFGETVYITVTSARLVDRPDDFDGKVVVYLKHGEKLDRLKSADGWDQVRRTGLDGRTVEGWVRTRNVSSKEPPSGQPSKFWKVFAAGTDKPEAGATMGAEGLGPAGKEYTKRNNAEGGRKVVEEKMDAMKFDAKAFDDFLRAGRLGDYSQDSGAKESGK